MYSSHQQKVSHYKRQEIQTASPGKLIVMLYDGAIRNIDKGIEAINSGDFENKEVALSKAQDIILELLGALDVEAGGEIALNLESLYVYLIRRITTGSLEKDIEGLEEARRILADLREAWDEIRKKREPANIGAAYSQTG